jgi:DNA-binding MarR family transcriptional regulator
MGQFVGPAQGGLTKYVSYYIVKQLTYFTPMDRDKIIKEIYLGMDAMKKLMLREYHAGNTHRDLPTRASMGVLMVVDNFGQRSVKELASLFGVTPSAATQLVDGLVRDNLIQRRQDPDDRRKVALSLTAKGKQVLEKTKQTHLKSFVRMLSPLTDQELNQFKVLQSKIIEGLK